MERGNAHHQRLMIEETSVKAFYTCLRKSITGHLIKIHDREKELQQILIPQQQIDLQDHLLAQETTHGTLIKIKCKKKVAVKPPPRSKKPTNRQPGGKPASKSSSAATKSLHMADRGVKKRRGKRSSSSDSSSSGKAAKPTKTLAIQT